MQDGTFLKPDYPEESQLPQGDREPFDVSGDCALVSDLLSRIGDKWSILVVSVLADRTMRFSELRRKIGTISQKMLTTTLRNLERDGFVERTVYPTIPPKVEYRLTPLGKDLLCPVEALGRWAQANAKRVTSAREKFDRSNAKN
jgi:DNA-binding HxlR family transcriptional regulator